MFLFAFVFGFGIMVLMAILFLAGCLILVFCVFGDMFGISFLGV